MTMAHCARMINKAKYENALSIPKARFVSRTEASCNNPKMISRTAKKMATNITEGPES